MPETPHADSSSGLTPEERERLVQRFQAEFGISADQVIERIKAGQGMPMPVVPWGRAIPSPVADDAAFLRLVWLEWGRRAYVAMFVGLACLGLSKLSPMHWVGMAGAIVSVGVAVWASVFMQFYRRRWKHVSRRT